MNKSLQALLVFFMIAGSFLCSAMSEMGPEAGAEDPVDYVRQQDPEDIRENLIKSAILEYQRAKDKVIKIFRENIAAGRPYDQSNFKKALHESEALGDKISWLDPEYIRTNYWRGYTDDTFVGPFDVKIERRFFEEDGADRWVSLEEYNDLVKDRKIALQQKKEIRAERLRRESRKNMPWYRRFWPWGAEISFDSTEDRSYSPEGQGAFMEDDLMARGLVSGATPLNEKVS